MARAGVIELPTAIADSHRKLLKAERAEALQLGDAVGALHRSAAERANRHAIALVRSIREGLQERVRQDDWQNVAASVREGFANRGGDQWLTDFRDSCVQALYEADVSVGDATEALRIIDELVEAGRQGLDNLTNVLISRFSEIEEWFGTPRMGSEGRPTLSGGAITCIIAAVGAGALPSILACLATGPFAPVCIIGVVGIGAAIVIAGCLTIS